MFKITRFKKGSGIKSVTCLPDFALKQKGKMDSKKGVKVADACIAKYMSKCAANESKEVIVAEEILSDIRKDGSVTVTLLKEKEIFLNNAPSQNSGSDASATRENRYNAGLVKSAQTTIENCHEKLASINENIISIDTVLNERILRTRKKASEKINIYKSGLRAGQLKDYETNLDFCDDARSLYHQKHSFCDETIRQTIEKRLQED